MWIHIGMSVAKLKNNEQGNEILRLNSVMGVANGVVERLTSQQDSDRGGLPGCGGPVEVSSLGNTVSVSPIFANLPKSNSH